MKRSELKEAIKAEIKSVLTEEFQVGDIVMLTRGDEELEVIDKRRMLGLDLMAYTVRFPDGNTEEYSAEQLKPAQDDINIMNEGKKGVVVDPDEIKFHLDQFYGGNIDGNDLANAIEEILSDMMKRSVTFSDIREDEGPTKAEIKKEKSIAKEKADALKAQKETKEKIDKIKSVLKKNKSEVLKISKIDRKERTKAEQSLFDNMVDKTKELKKLEKAL
jgi:hypothetical protein